MDAIHIRVTKKYKTQVWCKYFTQVLDKIVHRQILSPLKDYNEICTTAETPCNVADQRHDFGKFFKKGA